MVLGGRKKKVATKKKVKMPANIKVAKTLGDYKDIVGGERDRIVVVRFFAPWCKVRTLIGSESSTVLFIVGALVRMWCRSHQRRAHGR